MKTPRLTLICMCLCFLAFHGLKGQTRAIVDSFVQHMDLSKRDTTRVNQLELIARNLYLSFPDSALGYAETAYKISRELAYEDGEARSLNRMGNSLSRLGKTDSALLCYQGALDIRQRAGHTKGMAGTLLNIGHLYKKLGDFELSLASYSQAFNLAEKLAPSRTYAAICTSIGLLYIRLEDLTLSETYLLQGLEVAQEIGNKELVASSLLNLGNLSARKSEWDIALARYQQALFMYQKLEAPARISMIYRNMGNAYLESDRYDLAEEYYKESLDLQLQLKDPESLARSYNNFGANFHNKQQYEKALSFYHLSLKKLDSLIVPELAQHVQLNLSKTYEELGRSEQVVKHLRSYISVKDSLAAEKNRAKKFAQELSNERYDKRLKTLYTQLILVSLLAIIIFLGAWIQTNRSMLKSKNIKEAFDLLLRDQEHIKLGAMLRGQEKAQGQFAKELHDNIGMLLSAVNLHFSNLEERLDIKLDSFYQARATLLKAVKEVRTLSHNMLSGTMKHLGLLEAIEDLVLVIQGNGTIDIYFAHHKMEDLLIPHSISHSIYRIVQELFSNAIRHANPSEIHIEIRRIQEGFTLTFQDDGEGFDTASLNQTGGIGIKNMQARTKDLGGSFHITSLWGKGTTVVISVPIPDPTQTWFQETHNTL